MKNLHRYLLVGATCAASAAWAASVSVARADVPALSLEYAGSSRIDGKTKPIATFKSYTSAETGRVRKLTKYVIDAPAVPMIAEEIGNSPLGMLGLLGQTNAGGIGVMIDRTNDKFMLSSDDDKTYIEQPYRKLLKQLRFDAFAKAAPELSKKAPPELTMEQRKRLGDEVHAATSTYLKNNFKVYFRALPKSRNFKALDGVTTHGYRMTMLFNSAFPGQKPDWSKVATEWWVADSLPGDEMIRDITAGVFSDIKSNGGISSSMWVNEALPLMWFSLPQQFRDAVQTVMPLPPAKDAWYRGTLTYMAVTADTHKSCSAPASVIRTEISLIKRTTGIIPSRVFLPPAGYKKQDIDPMLKSYKSMTESILSPNGDMARMMGGIPFGAGLPFFSSLQPVSDSSFATNFKKAVRPN